MFTRISNTIASARFSTSLIALMAFLPFIIAYHRLPIPSFYGEWLAGLLGVLALLALLKKEFWQPLEIPQIALIFAGFIAIVSMQLMLGMLQSTQYGLLVIAYLLWAFLLVMLGGYLRRQLGWEKITTSLAWAIVAGGLVNIVFVALQYFFKQGYELPFVPNFYGYGTLGQLNHFASYVALALVSLIYLLFKKRINFSIAIVIGLLFLGLLAFSGSRSSWLYLIAMVVLAIFLRAMSLKQSSTTSALQIKQSQQLLWLALLILPLFAYMQVLVSWLTNGMVDMPNARLMAEWGANQQIGGLSVRLHIWAESFRLFMQSPWLGIGFGQTRWMSFYMLDKQWLINMPGSYEHAHNLVVHVFAEMGLAGGLLLLAGIVAWLRGFQWKNIHLETWYVLALLSIFGIHSMLEYPLWYAYFLGLAAFLLGAGDESRQQWNIRSVGQASGRLVFAALLVIGLGLLINTYVANKNLEHWIAKGISKQINAENQTEFLHALDWVGNNSLLAPYTNLIYANSLKPSKKNLADKLAISKSAMRFVPTRTSVYRHVLLLEFNNQHAEAVQYLKRAIQAFPHDFKPELQKLPLQYWDLYLQLFSEALAKPIETNPIQKIGYQQQPI
ncbi:MAG: Wzy polymerase domain-containing protein [Pseudomonadota bacterium]